jgi:TrpR-related protein YerC/YecD
MRKVSQHDIDELYAAILSLRNLGEAKSFFRDLLTEGEIKEFAERWKVATMLARKVPYRSIIDETGLSSRTVARVARWVNKGMGGYRLVLKRRHVLRD